MSNRKAMMNLEYMTVLIIFIMFSIYFTFRMMEQRPAYFREVRKEIFRSENYMLSELVVNDAGYPSDWNSSVGLPQEANVKRIGLSDHSHNMTNMLSIDKTSAMNALCSRLGGYEDAKVLLAASHNFSVTVTNRTGGVDGMNNVLTQCGPDYKGEIMASIRRFVAFDNGDVGEVVVKSWQ